MLRALAGALALSVVFTTHAEPQDELAEAAEALGKVATEKCNPAYDGDRSRGEFTNADLSRILLESRKVPSAYSAYWPEAPVEFWGLMLDASWHFCIDKRLSTARMTTLNGEALPQAVTPTSAFYLKAGVISLPAKAASDSVQALNAMDALAQFLNAKQSVREQLQFYIKLHHSGHGDAARILDQRIKNQIDLPQGVISDAAQHEPRSGRDAELDKTLRIPPLKILSNQ